MTAAQAFGLANPVALLGWVVLVAAVLLGRPFWRDSVAGLLWPLALSLGYVIALSTGFAAGGSGGSFSSLAGVRQLFSSDWALLAGWVHYLAFDLFVGAWIAAETERRGLTRLILIPVLPLTFLFGPAGFLLFCILRSVIPAGRAA
jgi:hypothetical protein